MDGGVQPPVFAHARGRKKKKSHAGEAHRPKRFSFDNRHLNMLTLTITDRFEEQKKANTIVRME